MTIRRCHRCRKEEEPEEHAKPGRCLFDPRSPTAETVESECIRLRGAVEELRERNNQLRIRLDAAERELAEWRRRDE